MKACGKIKSLWGKIMAIIIVCFVSGITAQPAFAQTAPTPTADADGTIYVQVQQQDTLWAIAATYGLTLNELLQLNNLTEDSFVQPGQLLIIGYATPVPTETPPTETPRPTLPPPPTGTAVIRPATGLCLLAFDDINGDGIQQPGEPLKANVAFTLYTEQSVILNYISDGFSEPKCFENLAPGTYQITRSLAQQERLTTSGNKGIIVQDGTLAQIEFGSTTNSDLLITSEFTNNPLLPTVLPLGATLEDEAEQAGGRISNEKRPLIIGIIILGLLLVTSLFFIIMRLKADFRKS